MTPIEKLKKLAADIRQLYGCSYSNAWGDAQVWKEHARELISDLFSDALSERNRLLGRLSGVFVPLPSCAVNGELIASSSEIDAQQDFERDIQTAQDIVDDCCRELERLS